MSKSNDIDHNDLSGISHNDDAAFQLVHSRDIEAVHEQLKKDGKRSIEYSNTVFLSTALIGVPLGLFVLPLTLTYQLAKKALNGGSDSNSDSETMKTSQESSHHEEVFPTEILPKSERKYDVVLLGATGFTGRLAALYLSQSYPKEKSNIKWAIAGRSQTKLNKLKEEMASKLSDSSIMDDIDTIIVDTSKPSTLHSLVNNTKAVISTAGPFWKYGSTVVEFCVKYGTNYVDTTGETGWNKEMLMKWNDIAIQTDAKIISLCGMDSIPWDLTVYKLKQLLNEDSSSSSSTEQLVKVECYDEIRGGISGGTIDTMITVAIDQNYKDKRYAFDPYHQLINGKKSQHKLKDTSPISIEKRETGIPMVNNGDAGRWTVPWMMSTVNSEVVKRSHALQPQSATDSTTTATTDDNSKLEYKEYWVQPSFKEAFVTYASTVITAIALLNPLTSTPMKKYVLPKPGQGPTDKSMKYGYLLLSAVGHGNQGSIVESAFYFPNDPGYKDTARMVVESGLCLAFDEAKLPTKGGGFYSPAVGMGDALLERLCQTGCKFASRRIPTLDDGKLKSKL